MAGTEAEAAVIEGDDMDGTARGGESQKALVGEGPVGGGEMAGIAVEVDDDVGVGVGREQAEGYGVENLIRRLDAEVLVGEEVGGVLVGQM